MRGYGWKIGLVVIGYGMCTGVGCVSLDDFKRLEAQNRQVIAEKEKLASDLYDERNVNDSMRSRVKGLETELGAKEELVANYRRENELLHGVAKSATTGLEHMAGKDLGTIAIIGPKLPAPLDNALKRFADEHPSEVTYDAARGSVKWKADLLFPLGSDVVKDTSFDALRAFSEILNSQAAAGFEVVVVGHTDNRPIVRPETKAKHPTNWHLSTNRAVAVGALLQKNGVAPNRVGVMGCSEYRPVADNSSEAGNSQNRRVEIYLVPVGSIVYGGA